MDIKSINFTVVTTALVFCCLLVVEAELDNRASDFSKIARSKLFVDKTSFIKDFIEDNEYLKLITAPSKSGKSTIIDMLKRFLAIPVDSKGRRISLNTTENYKLFCQPKLEICKNEVFIKEHMGKYPVLHINFRRLENVLTYKELLAQLRLVILDSFSQHKYLSHNSSLFFTSAIHFLFNRHCVDIGVVTLSRSHIQRAFPFLSRLLFKHFGTNTVLLLDEYDAFSNNFLFRKITQRGYMTNYLDRLSESLFVSNEFLEIGMMTGVLHSEDLGFNQPNNNKYFGWLGNHAFSRHYGLTMEEILKIINKYTNESKQISKIESIIDKYYKGYKIKKQNTTIYRFRPILKFFELVANPTVS